MVPSFRSQGMSEPTGEVFSPSRLFLRFLRGHRLGGFLAASLAGLLLVPATRGQEDSGQSLAKITAIQNQVETRAGGETTWSAPAVNQPLFEKDRVRTGAVSRAAILYSDQTLHRLNEKSELEILPPTAGEPGLLRLLSGKHFFSSRHPKDYGRMETPTVTAAIRGTEFVIEVAEDGTTTISMLEGVVFASNDQGSLEISRGEQAYVEPGKAPVRRILVRPEDAVAWTFYYPSVLSRKDADGLAGLGADGEALKRAASLLSAGQVDEARPLIEQARKAHPDQPVALALASVIELAANGKDEAMRLADAAVAADPFSASAALASSFAAQAAFQIERAREMAEKAAELDPESSIALARTAELRMSEGDLKGAREAAEGAVRRTPEQARALAVLGFVELAQYRTDEAEKMFERAVTADSGLALAHLGLGITRIRLGRVEEGREELQTAIALDPANALLRSYLGKAYYEEKRPEEAAKELAAAKELDPSDPTPYLYDAILKQNENRPLEALADLQKSISLNDQRAVYRSRLLLDQDRAVRATDLARIYNDLGFEQLGMVTARRSADEDHANYSSHLFLAGNYRSVPEFAPAFLSEVLQARIYQPASVNAARPDVVNQTVSFNEYTALFDRPRARGFASASYGETDEDLGELFPGDPTCFNPADPLGPAVSCEGQVSLESSRVWSGEAVGTMNGDRWSAALGYSKIDDEGFRVNSDAKTATYHGFFEFSPTFQDSFQVNVIHGDRETGDLPLRQNTTIVNPERIETELTNVGLGYHRKVSPNVDIAVSAIYNDTEQIGTVPILSATSEFTLNGPQLEYQQVWRKGRASWIFGAGGFSGKQEVDTGSSEMEMDDNFANGYVYLKLRDLGSFEITVGGSMEYVDAPVGLLTPRDAGLLPGDAKFTETEFSPKLGVSYYLKSGTTLRAAAYSRLNPAIGRLQTLEPTQVAGFNQFFEEPAGTRSDSYGFGVDQEFSSWLFAGASYLKRDMEIPEPTCDSPDPFTGCAFTFFETATDVEEREGEDEFINAYVNAALGKRISVGVDYSRLERDIDFTSATVLSLFQDSVETEQIRPEVRFFLPSGLFAAVAATRYNQEVVQLQDLQDTTGLKVESAFWIEDLMVGYRFPKRYGSVVLEATNLADREFGFYERSIQETVIPARTVLLRVNLTY